MPKLTERKLSLPHALGRDFYIPTDLTNVPLKELRKEYTVFRDIAQKRIKRLAGKYSDTEAYQNYSEGFPKIRNMQSEEELLKALSEVTRFVSAISSTVTGQKSIAKRKIETLHKKWNLIEEDASEEDLKKLFKFVDFIRDLVADNIHYNIVRDPETGKITDPKIAQAIKNGNYSRAYYLIQGKSLYNAYRQTHKGEKKKYSEEVRKYLSPGSDFS